MIDPTALFKVVELTEKEVDFGINKEGRRFMYGKWNNLNIPLADKNQIHSMCWQALTQASDSSIVDDIVAFAKDCDCTIVQYKDLIGVVVEF